MNYEAALQRVTTFASEEKGFVATQSSAKLPNGKLQGTVVVKVVPENLDRFLQKARSLGELKNQTLGSEDVTKAYFDTDARLRNAKRMEERLLQMLDKNTGKVSDLLGGKETGARAEQIEQMQASEVLDALVQYARSQFPGGKRLDEPGLPASGNGQSFALLERRGENFAEVRRPCRTPKRRLSNPRSSAIMRPATARMRSCSRRGERYHHYGSGDGRVQNFNVQTSAWRKTAPACRRPRRSSATSAAESVFRAREDKRVQQTSLRF